MRQIPVHVNRQSLNRQPDYCRCNDPRHNEEDAAIQEQLDRDRQQQKQTKDLKIKLEQTNLELEQEKALAEINKLKKENTGAFNEPAVDGQNNLA